MSLPRIAATPLLLAIALAGACGDATPEYTLHTVMLQMDWDQKQVEKNLGSPSAALSSLEALKQWSADPAFERYVERSTFGGDPGEFRELKGLYLERLDATLAAARTNDAAGMARAYAPLRMSCELCHVKFQPQPR